MPSKVFREKARTSIIIFVLAHLILAYLFAGEQSIVLGLSLIFGIPFILFSQGVMWSRWILIPLLAFFGVLMAIAAFEDTIEFLAVGIGYLISAWLVFDAGRKKEPEPLPVLDMDAGDLQEYDGETESQEEVTVQEIEVDSPSLVTRYKSTLIDAMLLFFILVIVMVILGESEYRSTVMIILVVISVTIYEPFLTAYSATIGQRMMGVRVRRSEDPTRKINIVNAYLRFVMKAALGWLSFATIHSNAQRRAIHDLAAGSVMIKVDRTSKD